MFLLLIGTNAQRTAGEPGNSVLTSVGRDPENFSTEPPGGKNLNYDPHGSRQSTGRLPNSGRNKKGRGNHRSSQHSPVSTVKSDPTESTLSPRENPQTRIAHNSNSEINRELYVEITQIPTDTPGERNIPQQQQQQQEEGDSLP